MRAGVYTLANDAVLEWLIAFLNARARNAPDLPVCVLPYDDDVDEVRRVIDGRPGVSLFDDAGALARADAFAQRVWTRHTTAMRTWQAKFGARGVHRLGMHRKLCAFEGPFERFVFLDADVLVLQPLDFLLEPLGTADVSVYDDQHAGLSHVFDVRQPRMRAIFSDAALRTQVFCAGIFAAHRALFTRDDLERGLALLSAGDAPVLYPWAPDQSLLNYLVLRLGRRVHNGHLARPAAERAATCVTNPGLEARDHRLFDRGVPVPFLHYIGVPITAFAALRAGRNVTFPYREIFLHYRWLHEPDARPPLAGAPEPYWSPPGRAERWRRRVEARVGAWPRWAPRPSGLPATRARRGIYVLANDRVQEHAIALLASLRAHDPDVPVVLIPYDDACDEVARVAAERFGVRRWDDDATLAWLDAERERIFGAGFFRRPGNFRKQACWFGPFDEFLYLDADIVVFEPIVRLLDELARADFVCCDDQHEGGLRHVFTREVRRSGDLPRRALRDVFNGGLFGARRALLTRGALIAAWEEAARRIACFDFAHGGSDQPILNDLVLRTLPRRVNAYRRPGAPRMWAGTPGFVADGPGYLTDPRGGRRLRFLHWAGVPIGPGGPYWDVWRHWRERDPALPATMLPAVRWSPSAPGARARAAVTLRRTVARLAASLPGGR